jgi:uncharacterized membrane protein
MIRLAFTIIAGVLLGGIVHLVSVLALPRIATQDAYSRLEPITKLNAVTQRSRLLCHQRSIRRTQGHRT